MSLRSPAHRQGNPTTPQPDTSNVSAVYVLANPEARKGRGAVRYRKVLATLTANGATYTELDATTIDCARSSLRDVVALGGARVVLVGGDGLVHLALQELAMTDTEVGIIPAGTGNDFAHALGLDAGALGEQVLRALGPSRPLDAIRTTHGWVASVATLGFAAAVNKRANALSWPRGGSRYTVATVVVLPSLRSTTLDLELDHETIRVTTTLLAIANTPFFGGGMAICPEARADDGLLHVAVIGDVGRFALLRVFPRVFRGTHITHPRCTMYRARRVCVFDTTTEVWGDGEFIGAAPIELEAIPAAFRVAGVP